MEAILHIPEWLRSVILLALGALGREGLFHLRRHVSGVSKKDQLDYLTGTATLVKTLKDAGVSMDELNAIAGTIRRPSVRDNMPKRVAGYGAAPGPNPPTDDVTPTLDYDGNNYEMKNQAGLDHEAAQARLDVAARQLREQLNAHEQAAFDGAQASWSDYRNGLAEAARAEYAGGTHAGLAATLTSLAETNRRTKELRADLQERRKR